MRQDDPCDILPAAFRPFLRAAAMIAATLLCFGPIGAQDDAPASSVAADLSFPMPAARAVADAPTFRTGDRIVMTHYFYWYRWPEEHMQHLRLNEPEPEKVSYESARWHMKQFRDMIAAGIDVALPVYWGCVDHYDRPGVAFSVRGLPPLVEALDRLADTGEPVPRIGLFYDTTTLMNNVRGAEPAGARADLRTAAGRDVFYRTVRDFFCQVPPRHWACIDNQPVVVLYSAGFAAGWNQGAFDELAGRFEKDFRSAPPFVIRDTSWGSIRTDACTTWGAALHGPRLGEGTVQIGAGYDDSPVPDRTTPIREREEGRFYAKSWQTALAAKRDLVLIETWNEHHEGTSICETREHGRKYIDLTAKYAGLFKKRAVEEGEIVLRYPEPRPRPDRTWGKSAEGSDAVEFIPGGTEAREGGCGIRPARCSDGPFEMRGKAQDAVIASRGAHPGKVTYLYFQVSDFFAFDTTGDFELELKYRDTGKGVIFLEYDSRQPWGTLDGAYTHARRVARYGTGEWRTTRIKLPAARFANRQNSGADFRLCVFDTNLEVQRITLRRLR